MAKTFKQLVDETLSIINAPMSEQQRADIQKMKDNVDALKASGHVPDFSILDIPMSFDIIENTEQAKDEHGRLFGDETYVITKADLEALQNGKCLATSVNDEYALFIVMETK